MMTNRVDTLVTDYLDRLNRAAQVLPPDHRNDLLGEIREHIAAAQAAGAAADEAAVRTLLDRLGSPEEIVTAAREDQSSARADGGPGWATAPIVTRVRPSTVMETWAVVMLTLGSIVPVFGWLVGVTLLWLSQRWRWWEKLIGTLIVPFGPGAVIFLGLALPATISGCSTFSTIGVGGGQIQGPTVCTSTGPPGWLGPVIAAFVVLAPLIVAAVLLKVARSRAAREEPVLRTLPPTPPPGTSPWTGLEIAAVVVLGVGAFVVPIVGPIVGLALAWSSPRWTDGEKTTATLVAVIPGALMLLVVVAGLVVA